MKYTNIIVIIAILHYQINSIEICINENNQNFEYLFAHGLAAGKKQLTHYFDIIPIQGKGLAFDCIDANNIPLYPSIIKIRPTAFGQEKDIEVLTQAIKNINVPIIGIGVSKGAACWINTVAHTQDINKIAALVLESPFANVNEIIQKFKFVDYLNYIPFGQFIVNKGAEKILCHYKSDGMQPITSIKKITNKKLPIFIIHSKEDRLIPINHSRRLYKEFIKNGFSNVYLVEIDLGHHAGIIYADPLKTFQITVNSFYKKFNLPYNHNIELVDIKQYQPSLEEIDKRIKLDTNNINEYKKLITKVLIILLSCILLNSLKLNKKLFSRLKK